MKKNYDAPNVLNHQPIQFETSPSVDSAVSRTPASERAQPKFTYVDHGKPGQGKSSK